MGLRAGMWIRPSTHIINRHNESVTQLPFELKVAMPAPDLGKRGYSNVLTVHNKNIMAE